MGNVARGLVPRWGRAWWNGPCQFAESAHNSGFSYLGVPAPAGMGDWYENVPARHPVRPQLTAPARVVSAPHSSFPRRRESRGAEWGWET